MLDIFSWLVKDSLIIKKEEYTNIKTKAFVDSLTGFYNRNYLETYKTSLFVDCISSRYSLVVLFLDIKKFKKVNDIYGHLIGDEVLSIVARCIRRNIRNKTDYLIRYGGDEFVLLFSGASIIEVRKLSTRLREVISKIHVWKSFSPKISSIPTTLVIDFGKPLEDQLGIYNLLREFGVDVNADAIVSRFLRTHGYLRQITASLGLSYLNSRDECLDDVLERADTSMYQDKS